MPSRRIARRTEQSSRENSGSLEEFGRWVRPEDLSLDPLEGSLPRDGLLPRLDRSLLDRRNLCLHLLCRLSLLLYLFYRCLDRGLLLSFSIKGKVLGIRSLTISARLRFGNLLRIRRFAQDSRHDRRGGFFLDRRGLRIIYSWRVDRLSPPRNERGILLLGLPGWFQRLDKL